MQILPKKEWIRKMRERLLNISYYFGFTSVYWLLNLARDRGGRCYQKHHYLQALALSFLLFCSFSIFIVCFGLHELIFYFLRDLALFIPLEISFYIFGVLLIFCLILWLVGIVSAALGTAPGIPLLSQITAKKRLMIFSKFWTLFLQIFFVIIVAATIHSAYLTRDESPTAHIYLLYDDMGYVPRWVFTLGFYRESLAAKERWGKKSTAVLPLSELTLNHALKEGTMIFVSSHGAKGYIFLSGHPYWPTDVERDRIGVKLRYVYLAGCDTGLLAADWEEVFKPATVKTFDRLSIMVEHIYWLIFDGPNIIYSLDS